MDSICKVICILCGMTLILAIPVGAWTSGVDITTGQTTYNLLYGVEPNTTAEFDIGFDTIVPPPAPGMKKYAYFVTTGTFRELSKDIRPETGWQIYLISDENISITWDQPPVPLSITAITMTENDATSQQVPDMITEQSLSLESGTHIVTITAPTSSGGSGGSSASGSSGQSNDVTYRPPAVETETYTLAPANTPATSTAVPNILPTGSPVDAETVASSDGAIGEGGGVVTVAIPKNTKSLPTQSPISVAIPLAGLGIFLIVCLKKQ